MAGSVSCVALLKVQGLQKTGPESTIPEASKIRKLSPEEYDNL